MKTIYKMKLLILTFVAVFMTACGSGNQFRGSAADRTGTNGATTGTGKIPSTVKR